MEKYKFYSDAGHGWLAVKRQELIDLAVLEQVSACSYQRGSTVYLEEDADATLFIEAYEQKYGKHPEYKVKYSKTDRSPIRSYDGFTNLSILMARKQRLADSDRSGDVQTRWNYGH